MLLKNSIIFTKDIILAAKKTMLVNETKIRVRYSETDQMGVVYHGTYLSYFEIGRTELIRQLGISYRKMEDDGIMLPVISVYCKYIGPARYDDELVIKTTLNKKPSVRIQFDYEVYNAGTKICEGNAILAFTNATTRNPMRPPKWFYNMIDQYI